MTEIIPVKVEWIDSKTEHGWHSAEDLQHHHPSVGRCETYGLLVEDLADRVTIAQSFSEDTQEFCNLIIIPRVALTGMRGLRDGEPLSVIRSPRAAA